jgi:hypothetical protein
MATALATVTFTVIETTLIGRMTITIYLDGQALRTIQMGEATAFETPAGKHTVQLVLVARSIATLWIPITRRSNVLELTAVPEKQVGVVAKYDRIMGTFKLQYA